MVFQFRNFKKNKTRIIRKIRKGRKYLEAYKKTVKRKYLFKWRKYRTNFRSKEKKEFRKNSFIYAKKLHICNTI